MSGRRRRQTGWVGEWRRSHRLPVRNRGFMFSFVIYIRNCGGSDRLTSGGGGDNGSHYTLISGYDRCCGFGDG